MKNLLTIKKIITILKSKTKDFTPTLTDYIIKKYEKDPYLILISCLLSLRAKDSVTVHICDSLFEIATTPKETLAIPKSELEKIIYKSGFYRNKAKAILEVSDIILNKYKGKVPKDPKKLLKIPGIGIKTANLTVSMSYGVPAICVDTHVHRISNRLGLVKTKTPEQTEIALQEILPKVYWIIWNDLLVKWGQNICTPISPWCSKCDIKKHCKQVGVTKNR